MKSCLPGLVAGLLGAVAYLLPVLPAVAADIYVCGTPCPVAPEAEDGAPGSAARPFHSLSQVLNEGRAKAGDRILLLPGHYGPIYTARLGGSAGRRMVLQSAPGGRAHLERLHVGAAHDLVVRDLDIWPRGAADLARPLLRIGDGSHDVVFERLDLRSHPRAADYMTWTKAEWRRRNVNGIDARGDNVTIRDSHFTGLLTAITTTGPGARVSGNVIRGFSGDGMRGLGDNSVFFGNLVQDCVAVNQNHDDGFQSWSQPPGQGVVSGLVIDSNRFIEWTGPPDHPLRCQLQGIGLFDGMYENLRIHNNLVAVTQYHGISVYGGRRVSIVHNTVVHLPGTPQGYPWILVRPHKNGTPSEDILVGNNLSMHYALNPAAQRTVHRNGNVVTRHPARFYRDPARLDYRLKPASPASGVGKRAFLLPRDITGRPRPTDRPPDPGAFQGE